jgi:hypothetical protein
VACRDRHPANQHRQKRHARVHHAGTDNHAHNTALFEYMCTPRHRQRTHFAAVPGNEQGGAGVLGGGSDRADRDQDAGVKAQDPVRVHCRGLGPRVQNAIATRIPHPKNTNQGTSATGEASPAIV